MLRPKEFLEQQFHLIDEEIKEALRHEYGPEESGHFFVECQERLATLRASGPASHAELNEVLLKVSQLGALIERIQHSHLGEFPWAFAEELRRLAIALCSSQEGISPLFYFSSQGRLDSYAVHDEQELFDFFRRPIFNVVFPRSLKHQVLMHPVLGHEIAHALLSLPKPAAMKKAVLRMLFKAGPLSTTLEFRKWLQGEMSAWTTFGDKKLDEIREEWREELLCDLLGLLIMGPGFTPALLSALGATDASGRLVSPEHPPAICRFFVQRDAIAALKWLGGQYGARLEQVEKRLWRGMGAIARNRSVTPLVSAANVAITTRYLEKQLQTSNALFERKCLAPINTLVAQLLNVVPPVGKQDLDKVFPTSQVDFRAVIYAGWLAVEMHRGKDDRPDVDDLNRLCELAMVQQRAITCLANWARAQTERTK